mgnify:CR=1 FL=1
MVLPLLVTLSVNQAKVVPASNNALIISAKGGTKEAARAAEFFGYTKTYRRTLRKVRVLNALPRSWRAPLIGLYNSLAWRIARKGL